MQYVANERGAQVEAYRKFYAIFLVGTLFLWYFIPKDSNAFKSNIFLAFGPNCFQDFVDYCAPVLWGINNKASLFDFFGNPTLVHQGLQTFMIKLTSDPELLPTALLLTEQMSALWKVVHEQRWTTLCPNILKLKRPEVGDPKMHTCNI